MQQTYCCSWYNMLKTYFACYVHFLLWYFIPYDDNLAFFKKFNVLVIFVICACRIWSLLIVVWVMACSGNSCGTFLLSMAVSQISWWNLINLMHLSASAALMKQCWQWVNLMGSYWVMVLSVLYRLILDFICSILQNVSTLGGLNIDIVWCGKLHSVHKNCR